MKQIPNILSILRLALSLLAFLLVIIYHQWLVAFLLLTLALSSDWLDGWLARKFHWESSLGKKLDNIGDTVFFPSILAGVAFTHAGLLLPIMILLIAALIGRLLRINKKVPKEIRFLLNVAITAGYVILSLAAVMVYIYEAFNLGQQSIWTELTVWIVFSLICIGALRYNYPRVLIWVKDCQKIIEEESRPST